MPKFSYEAYVAEIKKQNEEIDKQNQLEKDTSKHQRHIYVPGINSVNIVDYIKAAQMAARMYENISERDCIPANKAGYIASDTYSTKLLVNVIEGMCEGKDESYRKEFYKDLNKAMKEKHISKEFLDNETKEDLLASLEETPEKLLKIAECLQSVIDSVSVKNYGYEFREYVKPRLEERGEIGFDKIETPYTLPKDPNSDYTKHLSNKEKVDYLLENQLKVPEDIKEQYVQRLNEIGEKRKVIARNKIAGFSTIDNIGLQNVKPREIGDAVRNARVGFDAAMHKSETKDNKAFLTKENFKRGVEIIARLKVAHDLRPWYVKLAGLFGGAASKETKLINDLTKELSTLSRIPKEDIDSMTTVSNKQYYRLGYNLDAYFKDHADAVPSQTEADFEKETEGRNVFGFVMNAHNEGVKDLSKSFEEKYKIEPVKTWTFKELDDLEADVNGAEKDVKLSGQVAPSKDAVQKSMNLE